ncbi:hypothetical protein ACM26V_04495 [Salipaludibacillus sp. HK11]|uniref:hypothetical protein n=1 Tax=Salipaludibacillus sp. HK11 TaxID=3394320 RepID=UPI0039FBC270
MVSLTRNADQLFSELELHKPRPITDILETKSNKDGTPHKKYPSGWKLKASLDPSLPKGINQGGIYVFWWLKDPKENGLDPLYGSTCSRVYTLQGKKITGKTSSEAFHQIDINITDSWLESYNGHIPLYVGKSADSIFKRMDLHLKINRDKYRGKSTSDQLRRGIERLFCEHSNTADLIVKHLGYSFISLHGQEDVVNRFYLEDYAIGKLLPLFNIDIER